MVNNSNLNKINNYPSPQLTEQKQSPGLGQAQKCGRVKLVNGIPTFVVFDNIYKWLKKTAQINIVTITVTTKSYFGENNTKYIL